MQKKRKASKAKKTVVKRPAKLAKAKKPTHEQRITALEQKVGIAGPQGKEGPRGETGKQGERGPKGGFSFGG